MRLYISLLYLALFFPALIHGIVQPTGFITVEECMVHDMPVFFLLFEGRYEQFVLSIPQGIVVNQGGVVTADGKIFADTETYGSDQQRLMRKGCDISQEEIVQFQGKLAVISSPGQENWYHWLLQILPRLKILRDSGVSYDKIYINGMKFPWQKESLMMVLDQLGISSDRLLLVENDVLIQADTVIVPSVPFIQSKGIPLHQWLVEWLHSCFLVNKEPTNAPYLYISRSKAKTRRIMNEDALRGMLERKGFKTLYLEELSILEQARYIHNAKIIVGPHGSGFTNLVFAKPGTCVFEIDHGMFYNELRSCFKYIAHRMHCYYFPFLVDQVSEEHLEDDMLVDIDALSRRLDLMTLTPKSFYFIRHGETDWNKEHRLQGQIDIPLNEMGREQALLLQPIIKDLEIAHVYYSPLCRAQETMHLACKHITVPKVQIDALKERHFGEWQGTIWDEVKRDTHMHVMPTNGESYEQFHERTMHAINNTLEQSEGKVLFVAHAGTFRTLCRAIQTTYEAVHNCQIFHFVAPDETCDKWMIYEL